MAKPESRWACFFVGSCVGHDFPGVAASEVGSVAFACDVVRSQEDDSLGTVETALGAVCDQAAVGRKVKYTRHHLALSVRHVLRRRSCWCSGDPI